MYAFSVIPASGVDITTGSKVNYCQAQRYISFNNDNNLFTPFCFEYNLLYLLHHLLLKYFYYYVIIKTYIFCHTQILDTLCPFLFHFLIIRLSSLFLYTRHPIYTSSINIQQLFSCLNYSRYPR